MISVVITEVIQFFILAIASLPWGYRHDESGAGDAAPRGARRLGQPFLRLHLNLDWSYCSRGHSQDC